MALGYELSQLDLDYQLLPKLIDHQQVIDDAGGAPLLGGYLRNVFEKNPSQWEQILEQLCENSKINKMLV